MRGDTIVVDHLLEDNKTAPLQICKGLEQLAECENNHSSCGSGSSSASAAAAEHLMAIAVITKVASERFEKNSRGKKGDLDVNTAADLILETISSSTASGSAGGIIEEEKTELPYSPSTISHLPSAIAALERELEESSCWWKEDVSIFEKGFFVSRPSSMPKSISSRLLDHCEEEEGEDSTTSAYSEISALTEIDSAEFYTRPRLPALLSQMKATRKNAVEIEFVKKEAMVSFDKVVVREYQQILGDNPAVSVGGPSLTIDWNYTELPPVDLDVFEGLRKRSSRLRDLKLDRKQREHILERLGYSEAEIAAAVRLANKVRTQRRQSINSLVNLSMGFALNKAAKRLKKLMSSRPRPSTSTS